jgi:hypothetical protein
MGILGRIIDLNPNSIFCIHQNRAYPGQGGYLWEFPKIPAAQVLAPLNLTLQNTPSICRVGLGHWHGYDSANAPADTYDG